MKHYLLIGLSGLAVAMTSLAFAPAVKAEQVSMSHEAADLNGDGTVTMVELRLYNMDQRGS